MSRRISNLLIETIPMVYLMSHEFSDHFALLLVKYKVLKVKNNFTAPFSFCTAHYGKKLHQFSFSAVFGSNVDRLERSQHGGEFAVLFITTTSVKHNKNSFINNGVHVLGILAYRTTVKTFWGALRSLK